MHYAIPAKKKYPIESAEQVKQAEAYFAKYLNLFHPAERTVAATCIEKRASELGIPLNSAWISNYTSRAHTQYSPDFDFHMRLRKEACKGRKLTVDGKSMNAEELLEKIASKRETIEPKKMVDILAEFDKLAKLDHEYDRHIRDPFFTVFGRQGMNKVAMDEQLIIASASNQKVIDRLTTIFGSEFSKSFKENPLEIYESMPAPEKETIDEVIKENS